MGEKLKRFLQQQSNREADKIMDFVNQDPEMADVHAPDEMGEALFARIAAYEKAREERQLSEEEQELIELGRVYKKKRKVKKYVVAALVAVLALSFGGITVMGGPEKVLEVVEKWIAGGRETRINSDNEQIAEVSEYSEEEAYEKIEEMFGFVPVYMGYMPEGIQFAESIINKEIQYISTMHEGDNKSVICVMRPNYKVHSTGIDTDDILLKTYNEMVGDVSLSIEEYFVEKNEIKRYLVEFEHRDVYYFYQITGVNDNEFARIIENIYFPK